VQLNCTGSLCGTPWLRWEYADHYLRIGDPNYNLSFGYLLSLGSADINTPNGISMDLEAAGEAKALYASVFSGLGSKARGADLDVMAADGTRMHAVIGGSSKTDASGVYVQARSSSTPSTQVLGVALDDDFGSPQVLAPNGFSAALAIAPQSSGANNWAILVNGGKSYFGGHTITGDVVHPTLQSDCGNNASVSGSDMGGMIVTGGGMGTRCTLAFARTWAPHNVSCTVSTDSLATVAAIGSLSQTTVTFSFTVPFAGRIYYQCSGY
jgi:hypothetical protein